MTAGTRSAADRGPAANRYALDDGLSGWLAQAADGLDTGTEPPADLLPRLADAGLAAVGVPKERGGDGGELIDAIEAIADVASRSLAAGFVLWGHRAYIDYLLQSPNTALGDAQLPDLLAGRVAGATGLSNAMKFLAGLEPLQITAGHQGEDLVLDGVLPWVTNLRVEGFHVAAAVDHRDGGAFVATLAHDDPGLVRSPDLDLIGMRSTNTAKVTLTDVRIGRDRILHPNAREWLPRIRPAFVGLQTGLSIGLARAAIRAASEQAGAGRSILSAPLRALTVRLEGTLALLYAGLRDGTFIVDAATLFELRIGLADIVAEAIALELQAFGGRAYLAEPGRDIARRFRESAFIPLITPSIVQLRTALQQAGRAASGSGAA